MKSPVRILGPLSAVLFFFLSTFAPRSASAQTVVVLNDFEDGTPQNWIPRGGGVVLTNTDEVGSRTGGGNRVVVTFFAMSETPEDS